jgi:hypothetical protein
MTTYIQYSRYSENPNYFSDPDDSVIQTNWTVDNINFIAVKPLKTASVDTSVKYKYKQLDADAALKVLDEWFGEGAFELDGDGESVIDVRPVPEVPPIPPPLPPPEDVPSVPPTINFGDA